MADLPRSAGVLLPVTSLPSRFGIGDLGPAAYAFVDRAAAAGLSWWQILPLNPTDLLYGCSPYHSPSAFAGNIQLLSPEGMAEAGWLMKSELAPEPEFPADRIDYARVAVFKHRLFERAFRRFSRNAASPEFQEFCHAHSSWLEGYALFSALKAHHPQLSWRDWPGAQRDREAAVIAALKRKFRREIQKTRFLQYVFFRQWAELKVYAHHKGIRIMGDLPIYVTYESADVWLDPDLFQLDDRRLPTHVAGVPPDYFSRTGQLWGNPLYRWEVLQQRGYDWWMRRLQHSLHLFDLVRIDHFRGLVGYWRVPAGERTASNGRWIPAPAVDFLGRIRQAFPDLPFIAEDLGTITPDVRDVMRRFDLPGMKVLLFAFGSDDPRHPYLPANYPARCVAYTGTHDNNTVRGWFEREAGPLVKQRVNRYLGNPVSSREIAWEFIHRLLASPAALAVVPMQDYLSLGARARMNRPARRRGNWRWRLGRRAFTDALIHRIADAVAGSRRDGRL